MIVTTVSIHVKDEFIDEFIKASIENHENSIKEPGNLRFDILQNIKDQSLFTFYEAYESDAAAAAHRETPHYKKWRDTVENWMASPRSGVPHRVISPLQRKYWKLD